ncbi:MAG TPA: hypothetical protein VE173_16795 [Longimicrobiales bacterium]|nr:hypothetical protein [Longimicrobiales bacterium]
MAATAGSQRPTTGLSLHEGRGESPTFIIIIVASISFGGLL